MTVAFKLLLAFLAGFVLGLGTEAYYREKEDPEDAPRTVIR